MRTNGVARFAQRALWFYVAEAVLVLVLAPTIRAFA
jgi:hypothetical protein